MTAAEGVIAELGWERFSMRALGRALGVDPMAIYHYFDGREALLAALVERHSSHPKEYVDRIFSAEKGYQTPKLDVRAAVFEAGKILLVKERQSDAWTLPGGFIDVNESLSEAAARETREETGLEVRPTKVAAIYDHRRHGHRPHLYHFYKIYMLCDRVGGALRTALNWYRAMPLGDPRLTRGRVRVPTTMVWSDEDIALGRWGVERTASLVDAPYRFVELNGVSHWIPTQAPEALANAILDRVRSTAS